MSGDQNGPTDGSRSEDPAGRQQAAWSDGQSAQNAAPLPGVQQAPAWQPIRWQPPQPWESQTASPPPGSNTYAYGASPWSPYRAYPLTRTFVSAKGLASIVCALFAVAGLIAVGQAVNQILGVNLQGQLNTAHATQADADSFNGVLTALSWASIGATLICGVAFMRWTWRSLNNGVHLGAGEGISSPRMSVIAWFIPLFNLVRPYQIVIDLHDRLLAPLSSTSGRWLIKTWWAMWILGSIVGEIVMLNFTSTRGSPTGSDRLVNMAFLVGTSAIRVADSILAIAVVRQVQRLSDARELACRGEPAQAIEHITRSQRARVTRVPAALAAAAIVALVVPLGIVYGGASATRAWVHYEPSDKSFSVSMPGEPLEKPIAPSLQDGMTISGDAFSSGLRGTLAFVITYYDYPTGTLSASPTAVLDKLESNVSAGGFVESSFDRSVNGRPGRQLQTTLQGTHIRMIACVDGERVYVTEVDYTSAEANSPDINRFLDSFTLP